MSKYAIIPIETTRPPERPERGHVGWRFKQWDFHDDCPDYQRELENTGWIKKPVTASVSTMTNMLKEVWTHEKLEEQFYPGSPWVSVVPGTVKPLTKPSPWSRFKAWILTGQVTDG